jgi:tetratricopeptide (TPR) repeat protein
MTAPAPEELQHEAFLLYEQGRYADSLAICQAPGSAQFDAQMSILAARNLFNLGRYEDAEACTRDLIQRMPNTSYLHSFLGRILEMRGEDAAVAEYTRAVTLDPKNQEALKSYAGYLVSQGDHRKALPILRNIAASTGKEDDFRILARSLIAAGDIKDALSLFGKDIRKREGDQDYLDALMGTGSYQEAGREAAIAFRRTGNVDFARTQLRALAKKDPSAAVPEYHDFWKSLQDPRIAYDYAVLLTDLGYTSQALTLCKEVIDSGIAVPDRQFRLLICRLNAAAGEKERALGCYEHLAREALKNLDDPEFLSGLLAMYREFLGTYFTVHDTLQKFRSLVDGSPSVVCLLAEADLYESIGDASEAKSLYYRAFRNDFLSGGTAYARFLARSGDLREGEKILLHVLTNVRKTHDLEVVAGLILDEQWKLYRQHRLLERLVQCMENKVSLLGSSGLECLSISYLLLASSSLRNGDYAKCKEFCLRGLDTVPVISSHIKPEDFLDLLKTCKDEGLCDLPVMAIRQGEETREEFSESFERFLESSDPQEKKIIEFLIEHHEASEMDLRRLLNTRRVVGIVNRIIQKASAQGLMVIEKRGSGEGGELYAFIAS